MIGDFFKVSWLEDDKIPVGNADYELDDIFGLMDPAEVRDWRPLVFQVDAEPKGLVDYQPCNAGLRLCSARMRSLLDAGCGSNDRLQWLPAEVRDIFEDSHDYFVLHIPQPQGDVLDLEKSFIIRHETHDSVVQPVLDSEKVAGKHVLRATDSAVSLVVSREIRQQLLDAGCTGMEFSKVRVS